MKGFNIVNRLLHTFECPLMLPGYGDYDVHYTMRLVTFTLEVNNETLDSCGFDTLGRC